jgi:hypothetical protein
MEFNIAVVIVKNNNYQRYNEVLVFRVTNKKAPTD